MFGPRITHVELDEQDGVLISFSDGTFAGYVAEELLDLRPSRESTTDWTPGTDRRLDAADLKIRSSTTGMKFFV